MEAFIRNLFLESLSRFIQAQVLRRDNGIIFIWLKMRQGSRFACRVMTLKKWLVTHSINSAGVTPNLVTNVLIWLRIHQGFTTAILTRTDLISRRNAAMWALCAS